MRTRLAAVVVGFGLLIGWDAAFVQAHHAFSAEFDADKHIKVTGTLTRMQWVNPHVWLHVDVKMPDGTIENWAVEGGTPTALYRRGMSKTDFPAGIVLVIEGYGAKDGSQRMNGRDLKFPDGRSFFLGSSGTGAPQDGRDSTQRP